MVRPGRVGLAVIVQFFISHWSYGINQNTSWPAISCYVCSHLENVACDKDVTILKKDVKRHVASFATQQFRGKAAWSHDGLVLPLQPYCYTSVVRVLKDGEVISFFDRGGAYPGAGDASGCVKEHTETKQQWDENNQHPALKYYIFCRTAFCNTITMEKLEQQCFKNNEQFDPPAFLGHAKATDGAVRQSFPGVHMIPVIATLLGVGVSSSLSSVWHAVVALLWSFDLHGAQALRCFSCADDGARTAAYLHNCYNVPTAMETVDCPDRYPPPNNYKMVLRQQGYCATWLEQFPNGGGRTNVISRGCVYPGGEPDNCLQVDAEIQRLVGPGIDYNPDGTVVITSLGGWFDKKNPNGGQKTIIPRLRMVKYCRFDKCNQITYNELVQWCFGGVGSTLTTRDLSVPITTPSTRLPVTYSKKDEDRIKEERLKMEREFVIAWTQELKIRYEYFLKIKQKWEAEKTPTVAKDKEIEEEDFFEVTTKRNTRINHAGRRSIDWLLLALPMCAWRGTLLVHVV
ncbi:uncharacterized protein LOC129602670 [Paramacrobiotus metropolitanus]|uniref:uncharacterized protein LOC129602670 n=1 Tax=Paramacrobiotus metropolitanus TaxID=2943436 RepID=UPI002445A650|nr:uncharacterized protein LOC129602670 [Paramacrobiotus metropolitanus]XP_055357736.1 uncharacterized protein LOC129602670 [Paramacrobiotus metropolitanus]